MRSLLAECGYTQSEVQNKLEETWHTIFDESSPEKFYMQSDETSGCMVDTGNNDARTEGMSYGMMFAVQMNRKDIFDSLWTWAKKNMFIEQGIMEGYFAWSCTLSGKHNDEGPAPDGEEYFAMALFFAAKKWGNGSGIYDYEAQAKSILHTCLHGKVPMWNADNHYILFTPGSRFSDPSYHLPHFYDLFAQYANSQDSAFWRNAATQSRLYIEKSCNPVTGMAPEYAEFDGSPNFSGPPKDHGNFYSDAYRVAANIGLDALWNGVTPALQSRIIALQRYFAPIAPCDYASYTVDGTPLAEKAMHPVGLLATLAQGSLAVCGQSGASKEAESVAQHFVHLFYHTPLRTGVRRYYDNCLYFFALLALSGSYKPY